MCVRLIDMMAIQLISIPVKCDVEMLCKSDRNQFDSRTMKRMNNEIITHETIYFDLSVSEFVFVGFAFCFIII